MITRNEKIEIDLTPKELALEFCEMHDQDQASFFNEICNATRAWKRPFEIQLQSITDSPVLESGGRSVMERIGDYSSNKYFDDAKKQSILDWIINFLVSEDFPKEHLNALSKIIGLFNECEESEKEIFGFIETLYAKHEGGTE